MSDASPRAALLAYRRLMRALHTARTQRGSNPWLGCPMSLPQLRALSLMSATPAGLSSRELARALGVGPSAITPLVDRLVDGGYATRREDRHDRRITRLQATERGLELVEHLAAGEGDVMRDVLERLTPHQLETVGAAFDVLLSTLEPMVASSTPAVSA
jgi:DNA-binding MarR family transcriptional regulator